MVRVSILTAVFLVALRLAIGWHFFFEGYQKVHTATVGQTETSRPFSSEGFFREAQGPLGPVMRSYIGEPDDDARALLSVVVPPPESKLKLYELMPPALDREWNDYFKRFLEYYKLDEHTREAADAKFKQAKDEVVRWLRQGTKVVNKRGPTGTAEVDVTETTPSRIAEYELKLSTIRDIYSRELPALGRDVEKARLRMLKQEAAALRADLLKDLDSYTAKMKDSLAELVQDRTSGFNPRLWDAADIDEDLLRMLEPKESNLEVGQEELGMPATLAKQWDDYVTFVKQFATSNPQQQAEADEKLVRAKRRYVRWLLGKDEFSGEPEPDATVPARVKEYRSAAETYRRLKQDWLTQDWFFVPPRSTELVAASREVARLRTGFEADIHRHTDTMKNLVGTALSSDQARGYVPAEKKEGNLQKIDWLTRWGLTVIGGMLLVGLLTRTACLAAAAFLLMTYLSAPAYPWLPASPMNEGNYHFINKNIVEMLALLALATTASGRWLGLDALIARVCCGGRRRA